MNSFFCEHIVKDEQKIFTEDKSQIKIEELTEGSLKITGDDNIIQIKASFEGQIFVEGNRNCVLIYEIRKGKIHSAGSGNEIYIGRPLKEAFKIRRKATNLNTVDYSKNKEDLFEIFKEKMKMVQAG